MGIFGKLFGGNKNSEMTSTNIPVGTIVNDRSSAPTPTQPEAGILNLTKGGILDLNKYSSSLTKVRAAAGWSINEFIGGDYDLDLCAFLMEGKAVREIVYYGRKKYTGIFLDGDNLTGSTGQNDDENIYVNLNEIPTNINRIVFAVVIYEGRNRRQCFGNVQNAYMRLVDEGIGKEICRYVLTDDGGKNTAATLGELARTQQGWQFEAIGSYSKDSISSLASKLG